MPYYKENTLFKTKNNRLHIFLRKDAKTNNWYGRTFIEGKQTQISSSTSDKNKAIIILQQWFDRLNFKKSEGIQVHSKTFIQCAKEFMEYIKSDMSRAPSSRFSIISRLKTDVIEPRSADGRLLGFYYRKNNLTRDSSGKLIGYGNLLTNLICRV